MDNSTYASFVEILKKELIPAMGCTEPIAIAFAAAKAKEVLGAFPVKLEVGCSGNIIKNVQGVVVPNSGGEKGISIAAILGAIGGKSSNGLEIMSKIDKGQIAKAKELDSANYCKCWHAEGTDNLYIEIKAFDNNGNTAKVIVAGTHTNIVHIQKNDKVIFHKNNYKTRPDPLSKQKSLLNISDIILFANEVKLEDIADVIENQISCNSAISAEGLKNSWGAQIGKTIMASSEKKDVSVLAKAAAAAGSDARMGGCPMPVVINSGSGNQGMAVSLPVIEYANELKAPHEKLLRALVLSNLVSLYQKNYFGNLSAFCGVVCAAAGAGAGIAYLNNGDQTIIEQTISNTLANVGGIICDGAKPSCAAKIASSVDAAILGFNMAQKSHTYFKAGEGLVKKDIESTIMSYGKLIRKGMKSEDKEILGIMLEK